MRALAFRLDDLQQTLRGTEPLLSCALLGTASASLSSVAANRAALGQIGACVTGSHHALLCSLFTQGKCCCELWSSSPGLFLTWTPPFLLVIVSPCSSSAGAGAEPESSTQAQRFISAGSTADTCSSWLVTTGLTMALFSHAVRQFG